MEIKKPAGQIIRDDVIRKRRMRVSLGLFFLSVLLILGVPRLHLRGAAATGAFVLIFAPALAGCVLGIASSRCPICDYAIYKSGACRCQPSRAARAAYIDDLKWGAAGPDSGGDT
ncbi:MAG: hypothetical protein JOZ96_21335 [Acidobacteria bacterium]|nr:hypothetical protein [Acidobacteriota bacterium]